MKKIITSVLFLSLSLSMLGNANAADTVTTEKVGDYTFNQKDIVGVKYSELTEEDKKSFQLDSKYKYFLVSIALRMLDGKSADMLEANVELNKDSFEVVNPEINIGDGDIFTSVNNKGYNTSNGFVSFNATADVPYDQVDPNEAFGFIVKVKDTNQSAISNITINPDNFVVKSSADELTNLVKSKLEVQVSGLPVSETKVETPVVAETPKVEEPKVENKQEPALIQTNVEKVKTGASDTIPALLLLLIGISSLVYLKRKKEVNL